MNFHASLLKSLRYISYYYINNIIHFKTHDFEPTKAYEVAASVRKSDLLIDTFQKQFEE